MCVYEHTHTHTHTIAHCPPLSNVLRFFFFAFAAHSQASRQWRGVVTPRGVNSTKNY